MNNDLISRADTLKAFGLSEKTRKYGGDHSGYDTMMLYEIQDTIEDMESVSAVPLSVIEDIKTEVFRQSEQNNENFSHDWNEGFNDGMFHTLTIIREIFKHISGKEN